jgi:serine/threonine protein phosphatase PrpC
MGIYLSSPDTKKSPVDGENAFCAYGANSMQGWRMNMEDAHISNGEFDTNSALFAVFDGHGGAEVARFCSKNFGNELKKLAEYKQGNYEAALKRCFLLMDEILVTPEGQKQLKALTDKDNSESNAGCTANVILIKDKKIYIANSGDSRSLLYKGGKVTRLSEDHKPDNEIERQRISNAGGFIIDGRVNGNLNLSRAIGDLEYKKNPKLKPEEQLISAMPDVRVIPMENEDTYILMGCDGVWEILSDEEICKMVKDKMSTEKSLSTIIGELLDKCLAPDTTQGVGCDNMSAVLIKFK